MQGEDILGAELSRAQELGQVFAVVDAAHFDFLQDTLTAERFKFDPLYLDEVDNPSIASGPHLVHVTGPSQIARLRNIVGDEPACVWWVWPDVPGAGDAIYRHLRGLNMVEIPRDRYDQEDEGERGPGHEAVLFRHGDTNTMMSMLLVLFPEQISRLFGQAKAIIVDSPEHGTTRTFKRPDSLPAVRHGVLRIIDGDQYSKLGYAPVESARAETATSLREAYPEFIDNIGEDRFQSLLLSAEEIGLQLGFRTENAFFQWSAIHLLTLGDLAQTPDFMNRMRALDGDIDAHIDEAFVGFHDELDTLVGET